MSEIAGNDQKLPETAKNHRLTTAKSTFVCKLYVLKEVTNENYRVLGIVENGWKLQKTAGNGLKNCQFF